ncbi:unnamed protein product [Symbiodinium sp. CCMP2592]|nr:unnamed protein product [Symbiodinium sp. CCMP2592]
MQALEEGRLPCRVLEFGIPDFGGPADAKAYREVIGELAAILTEGRNIVLHCYGGVGRTGTAAVAVLCSLGIELEEASKWVAQAGSGPETPVQMAFLQDHFANTKACTATPCRSETDKDNDKRSLEPDVSTKEGHSYASLNMSWWQRPPTKVTIATFRPEEKD